MNAKIFGAFLGRIRKEQGMTQAELAGKLNVTDKAVSRWERGIGLPDINLLEPLADALGLSLADLMHCHESQESQQEDVTLEDFLSMLQQQEIPDWRSVRVAMFWLTIILAVCGLILCRGTIAVQWRATGSEIIPFNEMQSFVVFPLLAAGEFFSLELWNIYEQVGLFLEWSNRNIAITHPILYSSPFIRLIKTSFDFFFFIICGFVLPATELFLIAANLWV